MKSKTTAIIISLSIAFCCHSQNITPSIINSSGGFSQQGYYQFEWSIGELALVNEMKNNINGVVVTNGFLQPYLLYPNSYNPNQQFGAEEIKVFPNPASSYVEVDFLTKGKGSMGLALFNDVGQKLYSKQFYSDGLDRIERIPVSYLTGGVYILHVELKSGNFVTKQGNYKIIKAD
jgi:hypothetical protein